MSDILKKTKPAVYVVVVCVLFFQMFIMFQQTQTIQHYVNMSIDLATTNQKLQRQLKELRDASQAFLEEQEKLRQETESVRSTCHDLQTRTDQLVTSCVALAKEHKKLQQEFAKQNAR